MNSHSQHSNKNHIKSRHWLWMTICCLAVIAAIIILPRYFNIGALGFILLILLCPVLHYFFMRKMHKKEEDAGHRNH